MKEFVVTSNELKKMFLDETIIDTNDGWFIDDKEIEIVAIHEQKPKYIHDIATAGKYKIKEKTYFT